MVQQLSRAHVQISSLPIYQGSSLPVEFESAEHPCTSLNSKPTNCLIMQLHFEVKEFQQSEAKGLEMSRICLIDGISETCPQGCTDLKRRYDCNFLLNSWLSSRTVEAQWFEFLVQHVLESPCAALNFCV